MATFVWLSQPADAIFQFVARVAHNCLVIPFPFYLRDVIVPVMSGYSGHMCAATLVYLWDFVLCMCGGKDCRLSADPARYFGNTYADHFQSATPSDRICFSQQLYHKVVSAVGRGAHSFPSTGTPSVYIW